MVNLTINDKKLIQLLLEKGSTTNTEICSKLRISKQAVGKIRRKLEDKDVIKGYSVNLNLRSLGINILSLIKLNLIGSDPNIYSEIKNWIDNKTELIRAQMILVGKPTIFLICGFSNLERLNLFVKEIPKNEYLSIEEVLISEPDDILKDSYQDLIVDIFKQQNSTYLR